MGKIEPVKNLKLTNVWGNYYDFRLNLLVLYNKQKVTRAFYDSFHSVETLSLPTFELQQAAKKIYVNKVAKEFRDNAWFRQLFTGYTPEEKKDIVKTLKETKTSILIRQKMLDEAMKQNFDNYNGDEDPNATYDVGSFKSYDSLRDIPRKFKIKASEAYYAVRRKTPLKTYWYFASDNQSDCVGFVNQIIQKNNFEIVAVLQWDPVHTYNKWNDKGILINDSNGFLLK
jgi:hypothetical protein